MEPRPINNIIHASKNTTYFYDPSVVDPEDIKDNLGKGIHRKGERVNTLHTLTPGRTVLFIDGANESHVLWAINHEAKNKDIILVRGRIIDLMQEYDVRLYFDQNSVLTDKFGIKAYPAEVTQFGKLLKIREVSI